VITDVTGVKECIVYEIQSLLPDGVEFISAHPMAGRETSGVENADDGMFKNANYIVVPTEKNSLDTIELCGDLGETLGFREISVLSPEKHDQMIAFLSQLTHCIAVSLMCACDAPDLERYTGDSFRDLTRIANINDEMWSELFLSNKQTLLQEMDKYRQAFDQLYGSIKNGNREELRQMMQLSTARRKKFDKKKN
ncbi:MAG: prephenate dehydrogenase, partial [Clostridia bacterium]|nr:prephenate dehydrogenase [Clostridia bacterium]